MDFDVPAGHRIKLKESEKKDKYLDLARELKKTVEHESESYTDCNWYSWYRHQTIGKRTSGLGNKRASGDNRNNSIAEISQNTEKSPGDLRKNAKPGWKVSFEGLIKKLQQQVRELKKKKSCNDILI